MPVPASVCPIHLPRFPHLGLALVPPSAPSICLRFPTLVYSMPSSAASACLRFPTWVLALLRACLIHLSSFPHLVLLYALVRCIHLSWFPYLSLLYALVRCIRLSSFPPTWVLTLLPCLPHPPAFVSPPCLPLFPLLVTNGGACAVVKMIFGGKMADNRSLKKIPTSDAGLFSQCKKDGGFVPYYIRQMQHATAKKALSFGFLLRLCQGSDEVPVQLKQVRSCSYVPGGCSRAFVEVSIVFPFPVLLLVVVLVAIPTAVFFRC